MKPSYEELEKRIEELEKRESTFKLNMEKYSILFNQSPDAVVIINPEDASIIEFNEQLCRQLGYTREELAKLKISDIDILETPEDTKKRFQSIIENGSSSFETKQKTKSGEIRDIYVIAQYLQFGNNDNIYHCIWRDITEQKRTQDEKAKSALLLENLAAQVPGAIYQFRFYPDGSSSFPFASENIYNIYEVTPDDVKNDSAKVLSRIHPNDYQDVFDSIVKSFETLDIWEKDYRVVLPIRGERWLRGVSKPEKLKDGSVLWHGYIKDITEKKNAEELLKKNEAKLNTYINSSPIGIFVADSQGNFVDINPSAIELTGYSREELLTLTINDIINPIELEMAFEHFNLAKNYGFADGVFMGIRKNGEHYWFSVVATKIDDNQIIAFCRDVTHQIISEKKLRDSEAQLDNAMKLAKMGSWSLDVESETFTFNDNFYRIFGTNANEMGGYKMTIPEYTDKFIHVDDPQSVSKEAEKSITNTDPNYESFAQATIKIPNGVTKNIAVRTFTEKDGHGKTIRIFGVNQDITELKEVEKKLKVAKERAEDSASQIRTLINTIPDLVWTKDVNGVYLNCNHRFEELYGVKESDLIGKTDYDFVESDLADFFVLNDKTAMELGRPSINEEVLTFAVDGHNEYTETIKSPLYNSNNEVIGVLGIGRNITIRKRQELELIESKEKAENIARSLNIVNEIAKVGSWELDQRTLMFTFSDNFYRIFKTDVEEMGAYQVPIDVYAKKFLHPDDAFLVAEENRKALETKDPNYTSTLEHKILYADGTTGYMSVKIFIVKDEQGNTIITYGVNQDITERKLKEQEIKKLNDKYESFISNSHEGVYCLEFEEPIDVNLPIEEQIDKVYEFGYIAHCNLAIANMYGLNSIDDLLHKRVIEVHGGNDNPKNRETFRRFLKNNFNTQDLETEELDKDGNIIYFLNNDTGIIEDGKLIRIWGTTREITERKNAEKEMIEAKQLAEINEKKYKDLFTYMTNGFAIHKVIVNEQGKPIDYIVTEINPAYEKLTGLKAENLINKRIKDVFPDLEEEWIEMTGEVALTGKPINTEIQSSVVDKYFSISIFSPEENHFATFFNDITDRVQAEQELIKAKEKAEESDRLKSAFLCNVSHEIRTPLNAIVGFSALLNDPDLTTEERESFYQIIKSRSGDLLNIINDILDLSQIEANQIKTNVSEGKISELIDELYKSFHLKKNVENKNKIEILTSNEVDSKYDLIKTDFHRVKQILSNFLTNAFKFTKSGNVKISVKIVDNEVLFTVADTGIGISESDLPKVFERFRQLDYSDKRSYGGNGLGLSISKGLAELLGGRIWAESELNIGSKFYFAIPFNPVNNVIVIDNDSKNTANKAKNHRILIVEDDQYNLYYLEKLLKTMNYNYLSAKNGIIALELFRNNLDIDLILLDIQLPDISGMELLKIFKTERFEVPIIAQTAFAMEEDKVRILDSGCDDFIAKPIMSDILYKKIHQLLSTTT